MDEITAFERAITIIGSQAKVAAVVGKPSTVVWQVANGRRSIPAEWCESIERATAGAVTCDQLRPDLDWHRDAQGRAFYRERTQQKAA